VPIPPNTPFAEVFWMTAFCPPCPPLRVFTCLRRRLAANVIASVSVSTNSHEKCAEVVVSGMAERDPSEMDLYSLRLSPRAYSELC
jgi:hypothetical protein